MNKKSCINNFTNNIQLFGYLGVWVTGYVADGRENYWANQDEILPLIPYDPMMVLGKKIEKNSKGGRLDPFLLKNMFFSYISIIYHSIELKL